MVSRTGTKLALPRFDMLATALCTSLAGLDGVLVRVEAGAPRGIPGFELVGLPAAAVRESRVRVRSALSRRRGPPSTSP